MDKIDGISLLYSYKEGKSNLYTRGNGIEGQLVNHLIPFLGLDQLIKQTDINQIAIRGELVLPKKLLISNKRNYVSGAISRIRQFNPNDIMMMDFVG